MSSKPSQRSRPGKALGEAWVWALLTLSILAVYARVLGHDFINYDDPDYVTQNPLVQKGLTLSGLRWAFLNLHGEHTYWHPLTWGRSEAPECIRQSVFESWSRCSRT